MEQQISKDLISINSALQIATSQQAIVEIKENWLDIEKDLRSMESGLSDRIGIIEQQITRLKSSRNEWQVTLETLVKADAPEEVRDLATSTKNDIDQVYTSMLLLQNQVLSLQGRVGQSQGMIQVAFDKIQKSQGDLINNLFQRERPAIWSESVTKVTLKELSKRAARELNEWWIELKKIVQIEPFRAAFQALMIVMVTLILVKVRKTARSWSSIDPSVSVGMRVFEKPFILAVLVILVLTPWTYKSNSPVLDDTMGILLVGPLVLLIRPLLGTKMRTALYLLAGLFIIDWLRDLVEAAPLLARYILIFEILLAITIVIWFLHFKGAADIENDTLNKAWNHKIQFGLYIAIVLLVVSLLAIVTGFVRLGLLLGYGILNSAYFAVLLVALLQVADAVVALFLHSQFLQGINLVKARSHELRKSTKTVLNVSAVFLWLIFSLKLLSVWDIVWNGIRAILYTDFHTGAILISLADVLAFVITLVGAFLIARFIALVLEEDVYPRLNLRRGTAFAITAVLKYTVITIGFLLAVGAMGIGMDKITILLGALGVGLGFGLQTIVNSFVSGMILIFERPIQVGDSIEIGSVKGVVKKIGIRSSLIRSFDGADITVPNGDLLSGALINWTMADKSRRIEVNVGVAYGTDLDQVINLLHKVLEKQEGFLSKPAPQVIFSGFGDNSLNFSLRAWVEDNDEYIVIHSKLGLAISEVLTQNNIEIPFPQRDIHIKSGGLDIVPPNQVNT